MWESGSQGTENLTNGSPLLLVLRLARSARLSPRWPPMAAIRTRHHAPYSLTHKNAHTP